MRVSLAESPKKLKRGHRVAWAGCRNSEKCRGRQTGEVVRPQGMLEASQGCLSHTRSPLRVLRECDVLPQAPEQGACFEPTQNARSLPRSFLPSQKSFTISWWIVKLQASEQGMCVSREIPASENETTEWRGRVTGTQQDFEACRGEKQRVRRECWEPSKDVSPLPEAPRSVPGWL